MNNENKKKPISMNPWISPHLHSWYSKNVWQ